MAGPTQDQGAWASSLSHIWGGETGAFPHHTCGCSHIPLSIPGKNKTAELHRSQLSPEEATWGWEGRIRWESGREREGGQGLQNSWLGDRKGCLSPLGEDLAGRKGMLAVTGRTCAFWEGSCLCVKGRKRTHCSSFNPGPFAPQPFQKGKSYIRGLAHRT